MRDPRGSGGTVFLNVAGMFDGGGGLILAGGVAGANGSNGGPDVGSGSGAYRRAVVDQIKSSWVAKNAASDKS